MENTIQNETPQVENTEKRGGGRRSQNKNVKVETKKIVPKDIDPTQYVVVRNGFQGKLVYRSKRTGETTIWDEFGSEQEMELRELKSAKNSNKKFFINNWFMFDDDWIVDYLGVRQYYKNAVRIEDFDNIFLNDPDDLKTIIGEMSKGQKRSVAYRAKELISEKKIDSIALIDVLEKSLNVELIER